MLLSLYFPIKCNPSRAVTLPNIGRTSIHRSSKPSYLPRRQALAGEMRESGRYWNARQYEALGQLGQDEPSSG